MPCRRFAYIAAFSLAGAMSCSHQQEVKQTPKLAAVPPLPPPVRKTAPAQAVATNDGSKTKEGEPAIFFDFDSALVRDEARSVLQRVADVVQRRPSKVRIEGNCDEAGTVEYNLALGEERARAAKEYLVRLGVEPEKIATVTYGSQRPKDPGHDESAHARNRRDDFLLR